MKKTLTLTIAILLSAIGTNVANAQEASTSPSAKPMPIRADIRANINVARPEIKLGAPIRAEVRAFATATREAMKTEVEAKRQEIETIRGIRASTTQMRRDDVKAAVENRKEVRASSTEARIELRNDRIEVRASSTKARIEDRKAKVEGKIEDRLAASAKSVATNLSKVVARLNEISVKISARISKNEAAGSDMTIVKANLVTAQAKIQVADTAVQAVVAVKIDPTNVKASLEALKKAASEASVALRDAQASLNATVESIK
ncbi:MAG: hypothetical protein WC763_03630 [Candidatus Paceibacterota bacterium]|jgi:hypothetical protein